MASNEALAVAKKQGTLRYQIKKNKACYIMLAPYFILFFLFTVLPVLTSICLSFTYFNMLEWPTFNGWNNYIKLFQDSRLGQVALNTVLFALMSVVGNVGIGLLLAVILNRKMPKFFVNFFRFSFFLPVVIGYVYVSIVWSNLYSTDTGVFNYFLSLLGWAPTAF